MLQSVKISTSAPPKILLFYVFLLSFPRTARLSPFINSCRNTESELVTALREKQAATKTRREQQQQQREREREGSDELTESGLLGRIIRLI